MMNSRNTRTVCFTLNDELIDELQVLANIDNRKLSVYIREKIVKPYLEENK